MHSEEEAYAAALTRAIAADIGSHPPVGALVRVVIRWFRWDDPLYFTLHALGDGDEYFHDDAWLPLEWSNLDAEIERTDRVSAHPEVQRTGADLAPIYAALEPDEIPDEHPPSPAITEVARRLSDALGTLPRVPHFAVTASHFEAYGMLPILEAYAGPTVLAALEALDELPDE